MSIATLSNPHLGPQIPLPDASIGQPVNGQGTPELWDHGCCVMHSLIIPGLPEQLDVSHRPLTSCCLPEQVL